jgi:hypothetical protein
MKGLVLACAAIVAIPRAARADADLDAVKKVVTAQAMSIQHDTPDVFAQSFAKDAFLIVYGGYYPGDRAADAYNRTWNAGESSNRVKIDKLVVGRDGDVAWAAAELTLHESAMGESSSGAYRLTELLVRDGAAWKGRAFLFSSGTKDDPARWADSPPRAEKPPGADGASSPIAAWLKSPGDLAAHLRKGDDVIVRGSEASERGAGAGAAKLLTSWKKLAFAIDWARAGGDGTTYAWVAARVSRTAKVKGADVAEPYWALLLAHKGAADWEIVGLTYSQIQPEPDE